jgi:hypothetical protein
MTIQRVRVIPVTILTGCLTVMFALTDSTALSHPMETQAQKAEREKPVTLGVQPVEPRDRDSSRPALEQRALEKIFGQASASTSENGRTLLASRFQKSIEQQLWNKAVLSCDAVQLLSKFSTNALANSSSAYASNKNQNEILEAAGDKYNRFLSELIANGEKLKNGRVLIMGETVENTALRFCPLIPIC